MYNPYGIDLGCTLYEALWNDPARPPDVTVAQWAESVLTAWLIAGQLLKEDEP